MVIKHEELVTFEQANKIKKEVKDLGNKNLAVSYKQTDDSTYKTITIKVMPCELEDKIISCKLLKEYGQGLRFRLFNNEL